MSTRQQYPAGGAAEPLPQIEGYTVRRLIQSGGFSRVYEATQHRLERLVAIKVLDARIGDERQRLTFERECQVMGKLSDHQNIVTVFASAVTVDRHPCIVMELCEGTYRDGERLEIVEVIDVGAKLADALQAIHDAQVVHRDIKPHNIFVTKHGEPAIGDFGISSIENERTIPGGAGFSIDYAAPEVFEQGGAGAAGDIYSLGATLYEMASGEVPFPHTGKPEEYLAATIHKIIASPPPALRRADAPTQLDRLLRRCMAKRAEDRPADAAAVAAELRRLQQQTGVPDRDLRIGRARSAAAADPGSTPTPPLGPPATPPVAVRPQETTVARPGQVRSPAPGPADGTEPERPGHRRIVVAVASVVAAVIAIMLAVALAGGDEDDPVATAPPATLDAGDFVVLAPPDDLRVDRTGEATYVLSWTDDQSDVTYQVHLVGTTESRIADAAPFEWVVDDADASACFEVRSVGAGGTRVSQAAVGPVCASG